MGKSYKGPGVGLRKRGGFGADDDGAPLAPVDAEGCPVTALGHIKGQYWFFSRVGEERDFKVRELFKTEGLVDLFAGDMTWLHDNFTSDDGGLAVFKAARWLVKQCVMAGLFNPDMARRGPGVWRDGDRLIVHCGDHVLIDGERRPAGFREGQVLYPLAARTAPPAAAPASVADGDRLRRDIQLWAWEDNRAPDLVVGYIGQAQLGAAPDWRSHLFVRAPFGSGKTWQAELVANATGARPPASNITPASIYQGMTGEARALVIDEAEKSDDNRIGEVLKLIRTMSGRGGGRIGRGSAGGTARTYQVNGSVFLTAILHPDLQPQDRSRFVVLKLRPLPSGPDAVGGQDLALAALARAADRAPAFAKRAIEAWPRFRDTVAIYRAAALREDVEPRSADTLAALLAGRDLLLRDDIPGVSEAEGEIARFDDFLMRKTDRDADGEGERCLMHLLSSHVETWGGGERMTIGEKIAEIHEKGANRRAIQKVLGRCGLILVLGRTDGAVIVDALAVARRHVGLDRVFAGTQWDGAVWTQALEDLPGAARGNGRSFAKSPKTRCTLLPPKYLPGPDDDDPMDDPPQEIPM